MHVCMIWHGVTQLRFITKSGLSSAVFGGDSMGSAFGPLSLGRGLIGVEGTTISDDDRVYTLRFMYQCGDMTEAPTTAPTQVGRSVGGSRDCEPAKAWRGTTGRACAVANNP